MSRRTPPGAGHAPGVTAGPVLRLIRDGRAEDSHDAEGPHPDAAPHRRPLDNGTPLRRPLVQHPAPHGTSGWEDPLL